MSGGQPRQLAVLSVLAARANHVVSRNELVDAVWGEQPPSSAEGGIYTYIAGLRRVLEPDRPLRSSRRSRRAPAQVLVSAGGGYMLRLEPGGFDADEFERHLGRARVLRASGDVAAAVAAVDEALAQWRGTALAGVPGPFADTERQRLTELRTAAAEERADLLLALGKPAEAVPELTALVAEHPLRERACGLLMISLYRSGRQADALQAFYDVRERLAEELGIGPGSELAEVHQQVLAMDPALDGPAGPAVVAAASPQPAPPQPSPARPPRAQAPEVPAQVPPETAGFAGREAELRLLDATIPAMPGTAAGQADSPAVVIISGTAGVGKTTLGIRFARQAAACFPDGQLYVNLRGFDPSGSPVSPDTALRGFLDALGVSATQMPADAEGKTGLFRSMLEGKRMLLLLDNAKSTEQLRPLLPGSPGCMVLITSRSQLTGLVAAEGARLIPLDALSGSEARELLAGRLGADRVAAEPAAAGELILRSAGLPLALSVTCARAVSRPGLSLADLAAELRDVWQRLDVLQTDDAATDLRAVFSWSYDRLSGEAARMFRLLGVHPGPDVSASAAASLAGVSLSEARALLAELARASLLAEDAGGRFGCHDLLRVYAAERAAAEDSEADRDRDRARLRLLDHYLRTAAAAARLVFPGGYRAVLPAPVPGAAAAEVACYEEALGWFGAEQQVLDALVAVAAERGLDEYCWKLALCWAPLLRQRSLLHEAVAVLRMGLGAAQRLGDPVALGHMHYQLGYAYTRLGKVEEGGAQLGRALEIFTRRGDRVDIARGRHALAGLLEQQGRFAEALPHAREALRLRLAFGDRAAVANSENAVGWLYAQLGEYREALRHCRRALELERESGSRGGAAYALDSLAFAYAGLGDHKQAVVHYQHALALFREFGNPDGESTSLTGLGDAQLAAGFPAAARASWEQALTVLARVPGKDSGPVRDRLARLETTEKAALA